MILALNQYDLLQERGFEIDSEKLSDLLNIHVEKVVAVHNRGVHELLEHIIEIEESKLSFSPVTINFGRVLENHLEKKDS